VVVVTVAVSGGGGGGGSNRRTKIVAARAEFKVVGVPEQSKCGGPYQQKHFWQFFFPLFLIITEKKANYRDFRAPISQ
jgi:hypothetical protein